MRACEVLTILSQSRLGPFACGEVKISIISPFCSLYVIGIILPLAFAPTILLPTWVWIAKAKSIAVEPFGRGITLPCGVNAKTWSENMSIFRLFINWSASMMFSWVSISLRTHSSSLSMESTPDLPSLYFQCAAIPSCATRCISHVRI